VRVPADLRGNYGWEVESADGRVIRQYLGAEETPSTAIPCDSVVRFSFVPNRPLLPRHDVLFDHGAGEERYVRRFGRGFLKQGPEGIRAAEYLQVLVTNLYRFHVFSSTGQVVVTRPDYEVYL
jgi:hypothetical protein